MDTADELAERTGAWVFQRRVDRRVQFATIGERGWDIPEDGDIVEHIDRPRWCDWFDKAWLVVSLAAGVALAWLPFSNPDLAWYKKLLFAPVAAFGAFLATAAIGHAVFQRLVMLCRFRRREGWAIAKVRPFGWMGGDG